MAKIKNGNVPGHWHIYNEKHQSECVEVGENGQAIPESQTRRCQSFDERMDREQKTLEAIPEDKMWSTPVADGHAYYYIESEKPLVLTPIPHGDMWQAHPATIRGLRMSDVKQYRRNRDFWKKLQTEKSQGQ